MIAKSSIEKVDTDLTTMINGRVFTMYNGISMAGALLFDGNVRGKKG